MKVAVTRPVASNDNDTENQDYLELIFADASTPLPRLRRFKGGCVPTAGCDGLAEASRLVYTSTDEKDA